jgi:DNA repair protein RecO (recombination protein O)
MEFATNGVITRVYDVGASDKMLNIITADRGRIGVMVKGGRSPSSKMRSISQLFTYANFEISQKGNLYWLRAGSVINPFYDLSIDITRVSLASYLCDLANELTDEGGEDDSIMRLLLNSLYLVGRGEKDQRLVKSVFEMRAAAISGYCPNLDYCESCEEENAQLTYFDVTNGSLICSDCLNKRGQIVKKNLSLTYDDIRERNVLVPLTPASRSAIRFAIGMPAEKIFSFNLSEADDLKTFSKACEEYLLYHLGHGFDSLDLYYTIL